MKWLLPLSHNKQWSLPGTRQQNKWGLSAAGAESSPGSVVTSLAPEGRAGFHDQTWMDAAEMPFLDVAYDSKEEKLVALHKAALQNASPFDSHNSKVIE